MGDTGDSAESQAGDARRFAAFISYSHADADAAAKLQRKLERYRLPKRIAETRAAKGAALGRIFRDREDFAAAVSLSAAIREAISQAEAMVVICSPDAAASPWVQAEIKLFRDLHPGRPILAALLSGEPALSFPPALTADGNEPLAADLRPGGDGEQLAFLKIVAGIAGVPLDELIQRDAQRRLRRVTAITGAALAAMLVMGIMTTLAIQARNEAARQRAAAEGLVEYMLTDLREKLRGFGRPEVMAAVNDRAIEHYRQQGNLGDLPAESLERRARVLHAMGEDDSAAGNLFGALAKFKEAHRTTGALLSREPKNPERIFAHAQSEYWVGNIAFQQEDENLARHYWGGYLKQAMMLYRSRPDRTVSNLELGYAYGNLCDLNITYRKRLREAEQLCTKAIEYQAAALKTKPQDQRLMKALANRYGWLAKIYQLNARFDDAKSARKEEAKLIDRLLRADPGNVDYIVRSGWPILGLAEIETEQGNYRGAVELIDEAAASIEAALKRVPESPDLWESRLRLSHRALSASKMGRLPDTRARLNTAINLTQFVKKRFGESNPRFEPLLSAISALERETEK